MRQIPLSEIDQLALRTTLVFLANRLAERGTVDWALRLRDSDTVKRLAVLHLLEGPEGGKLTEPWKSAWRLIEESWNNPSIERDNSGVGSHRIQRRLRAGDRSGAVIDAIVAIVAPRLKVEPFSEFHQRYSPPAKRPKSVEAMFSAGLTSGRALDLGVLQLGEITEPWFLISLTTALSAAVDVGLDIARRLGWDERRPWRLGQLNRVHYVPAAERAGGENEPDQFVVGIAPSVKLLHAVVTRLLDVDLNAARGFMLRWKSSSSAVHQRLWAAMAKDPRVATADEVGTFLNSLDDERFWNLHRYPEIADLRARRFADLSPAERASVLARIRRLPPRAHWPRSTKREDVEHGRLFWAARELRRLELAGFALPDSDRTWLAGQVVQFTALAGMNRASEGFPSGAQARWVGAIPDEKYDAVKGAARLQALETALTSTRAAWDDDPADQARSWIRQEGNCLKLLTDFEATANGGSDAPHVWEQFGWTHSLQRGQAVPDRDRGQQHARVIVQLRKLSDDVLRESVGGIAHWFWSWRNEIVDIPAAFLLWMRLWRFATEAANAAAPPGSARDFDPNADGADKDRVKDLDSLNSPVGKLVEVFFAYCPNLTQHPQPFGPNGPLREMRDTIVATNGLAGLIARHRLIEGVGYFLNADRQWTEEHLLAPLRGETVEALALWRAIAHRTVSRDVMKVIGESLAERALDTRLDRETRQMLVFSLVLESLDALKHARAPAIAQARIQQTIRGLEDEVRAHGADTVRRFILDLSAPTEPNPSTPESLFREAAAPFLKDVWPLERSLVTPGVSRSFATLPAASGEAFVEAVAAVERFLVPFDCWSMFEYGLHEKDEDRPKLSQVDTRAKAEALLRLLDLTIGSSVGAIIPMDLSDALEQIRTVAPNLAESGVFRRLATAARRV